MKKNSVIIAGPTASGKSDFAHELAKRINGAIINCDSVQIYRDIETISASPFAENIKNGFDEIEGVPYKLFSILPLSEHISVADYLNLATNAVKEVVEMGKIPVFVGGSGYYINVLIHGISPIPEISAENREKARKMVAQCPDAVHELLPEDFEKTDPQRTARALEVFLETGTPLSQWQKLPRKGALIPDAYKILISPPRELLLNRIAKRVPEMVRGSALAEAKYIVANKLNEDRAIGASQLCQMLRGEITEQQAIDNWIVKTNQYAKRQRTWYKTQYAPDLEILHVPNKEDLDRVINKIS
ncbi:MAG: tRNA (adenosine(37)-N6)-dimethylallyltransferase MiaA [Alphaproteobacteria bacterium]|nr:tRNA (adenosine(37)-N6)-dimethylallyltransferase MiaA [Alphaproteobacteria bacterium]